MPYLRTILIFILVALSGTLYGVSRVADANVVTYTARDYSVRGGAVAFNTSTADRAVPLAPDTADEAVLPQTDSPPSAPEASPQVVAVRDEPVLPDATTDTGVPHVPFFSQFLDITKPGWQKIGCGIASLAMLIELYEPGDVSVDGLLDEGIATGAYLTNAGWTHKGLADLAVAHGLTGSAHDLSSLSLKDAFVQLTKALEKGPVIASVYYTFTPGHPIPHLAVINGIDGDTVYYNDPADLKGGGTISVESFKAAWKKRYIQVLPKES